jgi:hypothetical protein
MTRRDANAVAKGRFLDRKAQKPRLACRWSPTPEKRFRTVCKNFAQRFLPENVGCFESSGPKRRPSKTGGF